MSERATIEDTKTDKELDKELKKKCAEIFMMLDENKIKYEYQFCRYMPYRSEYTRSCCWVHIFKIFIIAIHIDIDQTLYISSAEYTTTNISKFDIKELVKRCEIVRSLIEYCKMYTNRFSYFGRSVFIRGLAGDYALYINVNENYDNFTFTLGKYSTEYVKSDSVEQIFEYLFANFKELMKPRFLNTKPAKLY